MRKSVVAIFLFLSFFASLCTAAESTRPGVSAPLTSSAVAQILGLEGPQAPSPRCAMADCFTADQCACSGATSWACVNNLCQYTYGGGGGSSCPQSDCVTSSQCVCQGNPGTCNPSGHCQYP